MMALSISAMAFRTLGGVGYVWADAPSVETQTKRRLLSEGG